MLRNKVAQQRHVERNLGEHGYHMVSQGHGYLGAHSCVSCAAGPSHMYICIDRLDSAMGGKGCVPHHGAPLLTPAEVERAVAAAFKQWGLQEEEELVSYAKSALTERDGEYAEEARGLLLLTLEDYGVDGKEAARFLATVGR